MSVTLVIVSFINIGERLFAANDDESLHKVIPKTKCRQHEFFLENALLILLFEVDGKDNHGRCAWYGGFRLQITCNGEYIYRTFGWPVESVRLESRNKLHAAMNQSGETSSYHQVQNLCR